MTLTPLNALTHVMLESLAQAQVDCILARITLYLYVIPPTALCTEGSLRLVNGSSSAEGRVEVCLNGVWGTVTDDAFGTNDAKVVLQTTGIHRQSV